MAIRNRTVNAVGYGLTDALSNLAPLPIVANRAPTTSDTAPTGTLWCYPSTQQVWINDGIVDAASQWLSISGGGADFCSLLVTGTCGGTTIHGTSFGVNIDTTTSNINIDPGTDQDLNLGTTNECVIAIGNLEPQTGYTLQGGSNSTATISMDGGNMFIYSGTGQIGISSDNANTSVSLAIGAGVKNLTMGSVNTSSTTTIQSGTGGISLATGATTPGLVNVTPDTATAASPTTSVTANSRVVSATFTGFTTAAAGIQDFTIVSSLILATSAVFVSVTCPTTGAELTITGVQQLVGSVVVNITNNGADAVEDNVIVNVWILN